MNIFSSVLTTYESKSQMSKHKYDIKFCFDYCWNIFCHVQKEFKRKLKRWNNCLLIFCLEQVDARQGGILVCSKLKEENNKFYSYLTYRPEWEIRHRGSGVAMVSRQERILRTLSWFSVRRWKRLFFCFYLQPFILMYVEWLRQAACWVASEGIPSEISLKKVLNQLMHRVNKIQDKFMDRSGD